MDSDRELLKQFQEDFAALCASEEPVALHLTKLEAWIVMGNLQLSLRHPKNVGASSILAESVARRIQKLLAVTSALQHVAEMGWDPAHDA